jgi:SAM-dependent methyltransferase
MTSFAASTPDATTSITSDRPAVNYFDSPAVAARYASGRPRAQGRVLQVLADCLQEQLPVGDALDVGCGTGHSTVALVPFARRITGVDPSSEMLAQATRHPDVRYVKGYAESLPFRSAYFDLLTVSAAYHWFDHEKFLMEAARVLRPGGWLALYKIGSMGRRPADPDFESWRSVVFNARYPKVARNDEPLTTERAAKFGFEELLGERWLTTQRYTLGEYIANLMTHSRIIRVVEGGTESAASIRDWLRAELAPLFAAGEAEFTHEARIHVLRRQTGA